MLPQVGVLASTLAPRMASVPLGHDGDGDAEQLSVHRGQELGSASR